MAKHSKLLGYSLSGTARLLAIGSQFALIAVIGNAMGVQATGVYASCFSYASIVAIVLSLGQAVASVKEIPSLLNRGEHQLATDVAARSLQITVAGSVLFAIPAIGIGAQVVGSLVNGLAAHLMAGGLGLLATYSAIARSFGSVFMSEAVKTVFWRVAALALLTLMLQLGEEVSVTALLLLLASCMLVSVALALGHLRRRHRLAPRLVPLSRLREGLQVDLTNWTLQSMQTMMLNIDVVLVGALLGFSEAGIYFVLTRLASLVSLPLSITNPVILPTISRLAKGGADAALARAVRRNAVLNVLGALVLGALVLAAQDPLFVRLTGGTESTDSSRLALALLVLSQVVNTVVGPTSFASQLFDVRRSAMLAMAVCLSGFVLTLTALATFHGLVGVAAAVTLWRVVQNLATFEIIRREGGFNMITGTASR